MRIIAGRAKGHTLQAPKGMNTRPTQDQVRESIFNVLMNYGIADATVLDLFSGTGAFALEALSRGAKSAVAVDHRTKAVISVNAAHCHLEEGLEIIGRPIAVLSQVLQGRSFDFIFSDPPYEKGFVQGTVDLVVKTQCLAPSGLLILERHECETFELPEGWQIVKESAKGYTRVTYCRQG